MTALEQRPLLFLDVDGPLLPFGATRRERPNGYPRFDHGLGVDANPLLARLDPQLGPRLRALRCEIVWATSWEDDANHEIAPLLGFIELPVVTWPDDSDQDDHHRLHWKTKTLVEWAEGRTFAWADDEITDTDRDWVAAHHRGQALLHRVNPVWGLTDADFEVLGKWLRTAPPGKG
ncbi:MAG TPA: HAD domain-containing protein [Actinocrinis sp.]|uniref:HAD domain-containing protein n=1 Tax=Actinocrinis sp. TaxID=1920516 RepID=UPI002DDD2735|nr:HAD domain-containing protein [Actinocrinis sp.]HEV2345634.1 HAD domain-containing protein [Actinocrinis sp.]